MPVRHQLRLLEALHESCSSLPFNNHAFEVLLAGLCKIHGPPQTHVQACHQSAKATEAKNVLEDARKDPGYTAEYHASLHNCNKLCVITLCGMACRAPCQLMLQC